LGWSVTIAALAVLGTGISGRLSPMSLRVPGTASSRAEAMLGARFGNTIPVAILLRGPSSELDRQGPRLVAALRGLGRVQVLSPWDAAATIGSSTTRSLRPAPNAAFVLVNYIRPQSQAMEIAPRTQAIVAHAVRAPVHGYMTGIAVIGSALQKATLTDTARAELIALPVLIVVLLLVFRSPVAAAVPLAMGGATVSAGHGLLWLASFVTPINSLGVAIAAMMSLALGVDYALLMVSRVRQELAAGRNHEAAVAIAAKAAGRTIVAAGGTLALTMLAASEVATPGLLGPVAIGVVISGLLSVALALSAMPALLRVLGLRLNRWEIHMPRRAGARCGGTAALAERLIARPAITVPLILAGMLALAAPAGALRLGPPDPAELPAHSAAREAVRMVERTIGPGWSAPFVIVDSAKNGAITTTRRLQALMRWQEAIARDPDVATVLGPASVTDARRRLAEAHAALSSAPQRLQEAQRSIADLRSGLRSAGNGIARLRGGLASAAGGARALQAGAGQGRGGALALARGAGRSDAGAQHLAGATASAHKGAERLERATGRARRGASRLAGETERAQAGAEQLQGGLSQAAAGSSQLVQGLDETSGGASRLAASDGGLTSGAAEIAEVVDRVDDGVRTVVRRVEQVAPLPTRLSQAVARLDALRSGADRIATGARESEEGAKALSAALQRLAAGGHALDGGLTRLGGGVQQLAGGLGRLTNGNRRLAHGLGGIQQGDWRLAGGLDKLQSGQQRLAGGLRRLQGGGERLAGGLGRLENGGAALASSLAAGGERASAITSGLGAAQRPLGRYATMLDRYQNDYRLLHRESPGALDSGYLVLTGLDGTVPPMREQVPQFVNVDGGGQAARMMVVAASAPNSRATSALAGRLRRSLPALAAATGGKVEIGQGAQYLLDYKDANTARVPWLVLALAAVATLTLIAVLRALLLPLLAVVLNLATIAVALGALELLTEQHILGGPGYIDATSGAGILSIMFVLSIDYEVFLLTRMREHWERNGDADGAIRHGLRHTASVITGSAAIMTAVFVAFAGATVIPLRQFGVGLTLAVLLDATIVRLVLLPAVMRASGPRVWWLPAWLERRLPAIEG
jgi:RND superfamily putative drug exporter